MLLHLCKKSLFFSKHILAISLILFIWLIHSCLLLSPVLPSIIFFLRHYLLISHAQGMLADLCLKEQSVFICSSTYGFFLQSLLDLTTISLIIISTQLSFFILCQCPLFTLCITSGKTTVLNITIFVLILHDLVCHSCWNWSFLYFSSTCLSLFLSPRKPSYLPDTSPSTMSLPSMQVYITLVFKIFNNNPDFSLPIFTSIVSY